MPKQLRLKTLLIVAALTPPLLAGLWFLWLALRAGLRGYFLSRGIGL